MRAETVRDHSTGALSRRDFVAAAAAGLSPVAFGGPIRSGLGMRFAHRHLIDCLSIDGPDFDASRALGAGLTSLVLDLPIYPRSRTAALEALTRWTTAFAASGSKLFPVRRASDFETAAEQNKLGIVLACQDASILDVPAHSVGDSNLVNLRTFYALGLRILQLSHNDRNGVADSYQEKTDAGLSRLGEAVVAEMNQLGMVIDLSHCGDRTARDTLRLSKRPCAVTHAGCRAVYPTLRNKPDEVIRAVADGGGLFSVFSMSLWLTDADTTSADDVVRHIDHAVKIAGIEHVGFASDGPALGVSALDDELRGMRRYVETHLGAPGSERVPAHVRPKELSGPDRVAVLAGALAKKGYAADAVDRIIGGNFVRLIRDVCG